VTAECYAPNSASRILDGDGRILQIVNNYSRISFNFGPTLLSWMEQKSPAVYQAILAADKESQRLFSGHGSAVAQAYNHMILPLASRQDKYTQILWGIRDFESRFGRHPEGMWLPETAADLQTLEVLADLGIKFTILSPYQAGRVRPLGGRAWRKVDGGRIDPSMAYGVRLTSGQTMNCFFYDGPISRAIAFEDLLADGKRFSERLLGAFSEARTWPQLVHIATDLWASPGLRRYGAGVRLELHRVQPTGEADQLRRISGEASADPGSQSYREQLVELRARSGTLEERLRLQLRRTAGLEPAVESALAASSRLAA